MILDTTVLIDFLRGDQKAVNFVAENSPLWTTEINAFELFTGAHLGKNINQRLDNAKALLAQLTVLPLDRRASLKAGEIAARLIRKGKVIEASDILIASIALTNGITEIVTANKVHYERIDEINVISY